MELRNNILYLDKAWDDHIWFVVRGCALPYQFDNDDEIINFKDFLNNFIECGYESFEVYESISNIGAMGLMAIVKDGEILVICNE